jgi:hypothetical protein
MMVMMPMVMPAMAVIVVAAVVMLIVSVRLAQWATPG